METKRYVFLCEECLKQGKETIASLVYRNESLCCKCYNEKRKENDPVGKPISEMMN